MTYELQSGNLMRQGLSLTNEGSEGGIVVISGTMLVGLGQIQHQILY